VRQRVPQRHAGCGGPARRVRLCPEPAPTAAGRAARAGTACAALYEEMRDQLHALPNPFWCAAAAGAWKTRVPRRARSKAPARARPGCSPSAPARTTATTPSPPRPSRGRDRHRWRRRAPRAGTRGRAASRAGPSWATPARPCVPTTGAPVCTDHRRAAGRPADRQPAEGRCARREVTRWLNSERVREALHAAPRRVTGDFEECSSRLDYRSTYGSMVPVHRQLLKQGAPRAGQPRPRPARPRSRALTGLALRPHPARRPVRGRARPARARLQRRLRPGHPPPGHRGLDGRPGAAHAPLAPLAAARLRARPPRPRSAEARLPACGAGRRGARRGPCVARDCARLPPPQVAGHVTEYEGGLTFATVLGAGHEVPDTNPVEALALFQAFVAGRPL